MTSNTQNYRIASVKIAPARRIGLLRWLAVLATLRRQRLDLASLDANRLRDLGLSAEQARAEAARRIWDVPSNWRI